MSFCPPTFFWGRSFFFCQFLCATKTRPLFEHFFFLTIDGNDVGVHGTRWSLPTYPRSKWFFWLVEKWETTSWFSLCWHQRGAAQWSGCMHSELKVPPFPYPHFFLPCVYDCFPSPCWNTCYHLLISILFRLSYFVLFLWLSIGAWNRKTIANINIKQCSQEIAHVDPSTNLT